MRLKINDKERSELQHIYELLENRSEENIDLAISLLKKYRRFKNTVFCFSFETKYYKNENRSIFEHIRKNVNTDINDNNGIFLFRFNQIFSYNVRKASDIIWLKFYIQAILEGNNSFYKG